jgi:hypothetical protein
MPRPGEAPHFPFHLLLGHDIALLCVGGALVLIIVGLLVGYGLGQWWREFSKVNVWGPRAAPETLRTTIWTPSAAPQAVPPIWTPSAASQAVPPMQDLIISPAEVIDKNLRTTRLLLFLAKTQPVFDPERLRQWIRGYFYQVQHCWQQRDLARVGQSMTAQALARFEQLICAMRRNCQINRVDGLQVRRLEFVHIEQQAVTALITSEARAYFVHETTGAFIQGAQKNTWYQEFWTFQRHGDGWKLHQVQQSTDDSHLNAPNRVDGLSEAELQNVERGAIML